MELLLIRHAEAVDIARSDAQRELTPRGRAQFEASVRGLKALGLTLARVLHSPFLRAVQTAELCAPLLEGDLVACEELADAPTERLLARLKEGPDPVALVGHEPWMSECLARLTTGDVSGAPRLRFGKGTVAWLRGEPEWQGMSLCGFFPPDVLRSLGESA